MSFTAVAPRHGPECRRPVSQRDYDAYFGCWHRSRRSQIRPGFTAAAGDSRAASRHRVQARGRCAPRRADVRRQPLRLARRAGGLGRFRQRRRIVRQRVEIGDDVGALAAARRGRRRSSRCRGTMPCGFARNSLSSSKVHLPPLAFMRGRIVEARHRRLRRADDAVEVRADLVGLALVEGMAGHALLGGSSRPARRSAVAKQLRDRLRPARPAGLAGAPPAAPAPRSRSPASPASAGRRCAPATMLSDSRTQAGAEHRAEDLVEFEGVHRDGSGAGDERTCQRRAASDRGGATDSRFAAASGNPYKRPTHDDLTAPPAASTSRRRCQHDVLVLIPARMAATRLPGKPLADIAGAADDRPCLRRAEAAGVGPVVVATDSEAIAAAVDEGRRPGDHDPRRPPLRLGPHLRGARHRSIRSAGATSSSTCRATCRPSSRATSAAALAPLADPAVDIATLAAEIARPTTSAPIRTS